LATDEHNRRKGNRKIDSAWCTAYGAGSVTAAGRLSEDPQPSLSRPVACVSRGGVARGAGAGGQRSRTPGTAAELAVMEARPPAAGPDRA